MNIVISRGAVYQFAPAIPYNFQIVTALATVFTGKVTMQTQDRAAEKIRRTISVVEASRLLGVGLNLTYRACARGELEHIRLGKLILVLREPLERKLAGA